MHLRSACAAGAMVVAACGPMRPPTISPSVDLQARLQAADALVRVGCFDCLTDALHEYQTIRDSRGAHSSVVAAAAASVATTAILLDLRERELGLLNDRYLEYAKTESAHLELVGPSAPVLDFVDTVSWRIPEASSDSDEVSLNRARRLGVNRDAWKERFRPDAGRSPFDAYVWLAFACVSGEALKMPAEE